MKNIETKLKEIADSITEYALKPEAKKDVGLYAGTAGLLMFMTYYSRYSGESKYGHADELLENCCEGICNGIYYTPFCRGLSGVLFGLDHLNRLGLIDIDLTEVHEGYSKLLRSNLKNYAEKGQFDFLHEATGIAIYLLQHDSLSDFGDVADYVKLLDHVAEHGSGTVKWKFDVNESHKSTYNISMSHGMSSVAIFLSQCIEKNIEPETSRRLLTGAIEYILQQEMNHEEYGSYFPYSSLETNEPVKSRLAWCYGDLGIAIALWKAATILNNDSWKSKAIEIMEFATQRRDLECEMVLDAGLCHGASGIAQVFRRMYYNTGNDKFLTASNFWIDETLKMSKWGEESIAGYMAFEGSPPRWIPDYYFLEGIAGIGLALLSSQGNEEYSKWDKILLLS